jgi:hypothetical protein
MLLPMNVLVKRDSVHVLDAETRLSVLQKFELLPSHRFCLFLLVNSGGLSFYLLVGEWNALTFGVRNLDSGYR